MKLPMNLLVPVVLGGLAFAINMAVMKSNLSPSGYVRVSREVLPNEKFEASVLEQVAVSGDPEQLRRTLIPMADRDMIVGTRSQRRLHPGDPVFWRDVKRPRPGIDVAPDERGFTIDIAGLAIEPSLLIIGNRVDVWASPRQAGSGPGRPAPAGAAESRPDPAEYQLLGTFRIVTVGGESVRDREENPEDDSRRRSKGNERLLSLALKVQPDGRYEPTSRRLFDAQAEKRVVAIVLRPEGSN